MYSQSTELYDKKMAKFLLKHFAENGKLSRK